MQPLHGIDDTHYRDLHCKYERLANVVIPNLTDRVAKGEATNASLLVVIEDLRRVVDELKNGCGSN